MLESLSGDGRKPKMELKNFLFNCSWQLYNNLGKSEIQSAQSRTFSWRIIPVKKQWRNQTSSQPPEMTRTWPVFILIRERVWSFFSFYVTTKQKADLQRVPSYHAQTYLPSKSYTHVFMTTAWQSSLWVTRQWRPCHSVVIGFRSMHLQRVTNGRTDRQTDAAIFASMRCAMMRGTHENN